MKVRLFILENSGDFNLDLTLPSHLAADKKLAEIRKDGGYLTKDRQGNVVFIPWHRVEYARFTPEKTS